MLAEELASLRRDLRATIRAYAARLEIDLAESMAAIAASKRPETLSRDRLHEIRDLTISGTQAQTENPKRSSQRSAQNRFTYS